MTTMPADVDERAELALAVPKDDDWNVSGPRCEELARLGNVGHDPDVLPGPPEDPLSLDRQERRIRVPRCGEREPVLELRAEVG